MSRIGLYLMTYKGLAVLQSIVSEKLSFLISHVCIGQDKAVENDFNLEIKELCEINSIPYSNDRIVPIDIDYAIAISWRWLIKVDKNTPVIVLHDSLLPKYRGFAPLVNALKNKEKEIGVTALIASDNYDTGYIIQQELIKISYPIKIKNAIELITPLYTKIILNILVKINANQVLNLNKQDELLATYSLWLDENDYFVDWSLDSETIRTFIDAVGYPYFGAKSTINHKTIIIDEVETLEDVKIMNRTPGKVIFIQNEKPVIVCGSGLIKIIEARFANSPEKLIPLKKFRTRFL